VKGSHGIAVKHLDRYLLGMRYKGIVLQPTIPLELICYINTDFCGTWDKKHSQNDPDIAQSRSGFVVFLAGALIF
jgi:hypothetical protein